jgi:hypothetical protein
MKTAILILALAVAAVGQTPAPKRTPHPHPFHGGGFKFERVVVNTPFSVALPNLSEETGCALTVRGPKTGVSQNWALSGDKFSGTPTAVGHFNLQIKCTTPDAVTQYVSLIVLRTAPPNPPPAPPAPAPIPLN